MKFNYFFTNTIRLSIILVISLIFFLLSRIIMIYSFSSFNDLPKNDLLHAFIMGLRVDIQVLLYGFSLPMLIILISPLFIKHKKDIKKTDNIIRSFFILSLIILILILILNYFFFQKFKSNFNMLVFALFQDNTTGIIQSILKNYPVIKVFIFLFVFAYLLNIIFKRIFSKEYFFKGNKTSKLIYTILFLGLYFLGMRGSIGVFPLGTRNLVISNNSFINNIAGNGILSIKQVFSDKSHFRFNLDIKESLKQSGFSSPEEALGAYLDKKIDKFDINLLKKKTPYDSLLEKAPPNIVFIQMESLSDYYLYFHSAKFNLLGQLEKELPHLITLRNFLPKGPRTIQALEGFIINNMQNLPVSQTPYNQHSFSTSNIKPFHDKGYYNIFASGEELGWRNTGNFYKHQYFDEVQGDFTLLKNQKNAKKNNWGVYDEFLFNSIYQQLINNKKGKALMFFVMTTTNHSPYDMIDTYKPYPLHIPDSLKNKLLRDDKQAFKNFLTFQYANDKLGEFIHKIRTSKLKKNTIIVATGDHTNTELFNFKDNDIFHETAVPVFFYIPDKYKQKLNPDSKVYGSHKDIFPTLYNISLSKAEYLYSGENLFDKNNKNLFGYSTNKLFINKKGAVISNKQIKFYKWGKNKKIIPAKNKELIKSLKKLDKRARGYKATMNYLIQKEINSLKYRNINHT